MASIFDRLRRRSFTNSKKGQPNNANRLEMVTTYGEHFVAWNGKLFDSDIVRACVRPKVKAIGKLVARHVRGRTDGYGSDINPDLRIRFLLEEPNPYMTSQQYQEKMLYQLEMNNNAFALIIRDELGYVEQIYPIPASSVEAVYDDQANLFLRFTFRNGRVHTFNYEDIIHLRQDFNDGDIFGTSPMPALAPLMECVNTIDQGIVKAIQNSGVIRWLLEFKSSMRDEDIKRNTKAFVDNYLSYESESFGAAATDAKATAKQVQPNDYVPNKGVTDMVVKRIYAFFGTNEDIVTANYDENQWNAYYEAEIEPVLIQLSQVYTIRLFTRRERVRGNRILFESANLSYSSMTTKLKLTDFLDRGIMNANEIREILGLSAIEGGDTYVRRLDTAPIDVEGNVHGDAPIEPEEQAGNKEEDNKPKSQEEEKPENEKAVPNKKDRQERR